tara:strand:- start:1049 stop:1264 length:216 start_codon:yes stop_codon:yes gene_type:complete
MNTRPLRFRCLHAGLWLGMGRTAAGQRYAVRVLRVRRGWWQAEHRIDGVPVCASTAPTLAVQRQLARAATH